MDPVREGAQATMAMDEAAGGQEIVASSLEEATHAEMRLLYGEASKATLFAKERQWKTVGFTVLIYMLLIAVAEIAPNHVAFVKILAFLSFLVSPMAISMLAIFHFRQLTESQKRRAVGEHFSSVFKEIQNLQSSSEANIHRHVLLAVMIAVVLSGNVITFLLISWLYT